MATKSNTLKSQILKAVGRRPAKGLTVSEAYYDKYIGTTYSSVRARMYELADEGKLFRTNPDGGTVKRNGATAFFSV